MFEPVIAETWLTQTLSANATLSGLVSGQFYSYIAPAEATYPFIVFKFVPASDSHDTVGLAGARIMTRMLYSVEVVDDRNSFNRSGPIAELVDQVLHKGSGSVTGGIVISCIRTAPLAGIAIDETTGEIERAIGGVFDISVQKA